MRSTAAKKVACYAHTARLLYTDTLYCYASASAKLHALRCEAMTRTMPFADNCKGS